MHRHFDVFCKYWPDDGPGRPELVASSSITTQYYVVPREKKVDKNVNFLKL
jgi:hypothetical protein